MAKTKISEFSSTPANNTDIDSINIAEGCAPSNINDAIRELMAQLKDFQTGAQGDSFNGPIGTSTAAAGAFTTVSATGVITSTLATGTAPLTIASTTKVTNLNADLLDGADWASPAALGSTTPAAVSATTLSASSSVTLSGGTANGVTYLNGSKVLTSGSALTFDGTNLTAPRTQFTTSGSPPASGAGLEILGGTTPLLFAYNRSTSAYLALNHTASAFGWSLSGTDAMLLNSTGLGIGTSSPAQKLTVAGNILGVSAAGTDSYVNASTNGVQNTVMGFNNSGSTNANGVPNNWSYFGNLNSYGLKFLSNGSVVGTWDTSGNLGLGVTPSAWSTTYNKAFQLPAGSISAYTTIAVSMNQNAYYSGSAFNYVNNGFAERYEQYNGTHAWYTAASGNAGDAISFTQAMTLDASGNLLVGKTASAATSVGFQVGQLGEVYTTKSTSTNADATYYLYSTGASAYRFYVGLGGTVYATSTTITAISDQRLKENIRDLDEGLATVMALKPRKFDWKEGKGQNIKNARGFIAQEFETVLPDMIEEWRDPAPKGEDPYKAINANLIPTLVKAIQELKAEFDAYKASHP